jgi:hypothetical protein
VKNDGHVGGEEVVHFFAAWRDERVGGMKARVVASDLPEKEIEELEKMGGIGRRSPLKRRVSVGLLMHGEEVVE